MLSEDWKTFQLKELGEIVTGTTPSTKDRFFWGGNIPFVTPSDLNGFRYVAETERYVTQNGADRGRLLPKGSVLITCIASVGKMGLAASPCITNQQINAIICNRDHDSDYVFFALTYAMERLKLIAGVNVLPIINKTAFGKLKISLPLIKDEQAAIACVLDAVDTLIERAHIAFLEAKRLQKSLIEDAFQVISAPQRKLREFTTDVRYGTSQASSERGWGNPVLRIPNVVGDQLTLNDLAYVDLRPIDVERLTLCDGDLLLVRTNGNPNYIGRSAVFQAPDERVWVYASYLIRVRLSDELIPDYVNIFLGSERGRRELLRRVTTSAGNHNINSNSIRLLSIPVPKDKDVQQQVVEIAKASRAKVEAFSGKVRALEILKKSLMHDLLTGTVRVDPKLVL